MIILVYSQAVGFGFIDFDDLSLVNLSRQQLHEHTPLIRILTGDVFGDKTGIFYFRPVLSLSLLADTAIGGGAPWLYHLSNILLHILACCLLMWLLTQAGHAKEPAFLGALVIGVHPALVQAVAWVPGRNDVLLASFLLFSAIGLIRYFKGGSGRWLLASSASFLLALFTKETAVIFLLILPLWALMRMTNSSRRQAVNAGAALAGLAALWFIVRRISAAGRPGGDVPVMDGLRYAGKGFLSYTGKILLPFNLSLAPDYLDVNVLPGFIAVALLAWAFWKLRPARPQGMILGLLCYVLFLLPALPNRTFLEHRLYLPLMGLVLALLETGVLSGFSLKNKAWVVPAGLLVMLLIFVNVIHASGFRTRETAWARAAKATPNSWLANMSMGLVSARRGDPVLAERYYLKARQANPGDPKLLTNLGLLYLNNHRPEMARDVFSGLLAVHPDHPGANYNLGQALDRLKEYDRAADCYRRETVIAPSNIDAKVALGASLAEAGRYAEARRSFQEILKLDQNNFEALLNLGVIEFRAGNTVRARNWLERAVRAAPERAEGHLNLGHVYRAEKRLTEAQREFGTAAKINPAYKNIKL
ncbi:MAG: tetratricopeptide repeat protein [Candidatus Edwardsbacteria bacterium]|nr:tetratricopeptide repeat protein [Candidatus Edwardsbacteria bacterium]